jgi:hypothetical protein
VNEVETAIGTARLPRSSARRSAARRQLERPDDVSAMPMLFTVDDHAVVDAALCSCGPYG